MVFTVYDGIVFGSGIQTGNNTTDIDLGFRRRSRCDRSIRDAIFHMLCKPGETADVDSTGAGQGDIDIGQIQIGKTCTCIAEQTNTGIIVDRSITFYGKPADRMAVAVKAAGKRLFQRTDGLPIDAGQVKVVIQHIIGVQIVPDVIQSVNIRNVESAFFG